MAITDNLQKLLNSKESIKGAIAGKGVLIPDGTKLEHYDEYIEMISTGTPYTLTELEITGNTVWESTGNVFCSKVTASYDGYYERLMDAAGNLYIINENGEKVITVAHTEPQPPENDGYIHIRYEIPDNAETYHTRWESSAFTEVYVDGDMVTLDEYYTKPITNHTPEIKVKLASGLQLIQVYIFYYDNGGKINQLDPTEVYVYDIAKPPMLKYYNDTSIVSKVVFGEGVEEIGALTLSTVSAVKTVVIGKNVSTISIMAFSNCSNLTTISYEGTVEEWASINKSRNWLNNCPATVVYCSDGEVTL